MVGTVTIGMLTVRKEEEMYISFKNACVCERVSASEHIYSVRLY